MALKIIQQVKYCPHCNKQTICNSNTKEMSWIMHLVLAIFTAGLWLFFWFIAAIFHGLTKPINGAWVCSECGKNIHIKNISINSKNNNKVLKENIDIKYVLLIIIAIICVSLLPSTIISVLILSSLCYGIFFAIKKNKA